jgi:hypothetical protein
MKQYTPDLYRWTPPCNQKKVKISGNAARMPIYGCTAIAGTQGQDWVTTYTYDILIVDYQQERSAYMACDYVV